MKVITILTSTILMLSVQLLSQESQDDFCLSEKQNIYSEILEEERTLFVYLPVDYYEDSTKKYPVHYISDAPASSNLYYGLIRLYAMTGKAPQAIVIGLSSEGRNENFHLEKKAGKYLNFIHKEVIPFAEENYRVLDYKVFSGHSFGANFVIYSYLHQPELFDAYIAGSPGPINQLLTYINDTDPKIPSNDYRYLYSSVGTDSDTDTAYFRELAGLIEKAGDKNQELHFEVNQGENHISNMAINFQDGFQTLYKDWVFRLPDELNKPVSQLIKEHYAALEEKFGQKPEISEWGVIFPVMEKLANRGDMQNAIDILKYCIELYPKSDQAHAFLAKAFFDTGKFEEGKEYLEKALQLNPENRFALHLKTMLEKR